MVHTYLMRILLWRWSKRAVVSKQHSVLSHNDDCQLDRLVIKPSTRLR